MPVPGPYAYPAIVTNKVRISRQRAAYLHNNSGFPIYVCNAGENPSDGYVINAPYSARKFSEAMKSFFGSGVKASTAQFWVRASIVAPKDRLDEVDYEGKPSRYPYRTGP